MKVVDKSVKYDRQLRLWGDHGQDALGKASVCLINATATGTETLKNIILPGVGRFVIVDDQILTSSNVGNNFFLSPSSLGQPRGQVAYEFLQELNPDVLGEFINSSLTNVLSSDLFTTMSLVVATDLTEDQLIKLSELLWKLDIPLLTSISYGLISYVRLSVKEHWVCETHPDNPRIDLRLDKIHMIPGLLQWIDDQNLDTMSNEEFMHTPYLVILYKKLSEWRNVTKQNFPSSFKDKKLIKDLVRNAIRPSKSEHEIDEENFTEALNAVNSVFNPSRLDEELTALFTDVKCQSLTAESTFDWVLCRALCDFVSSSGEGLLPVKGSVPDMRSDTSRYVQLQTFYKNANDRDVKNVRQRTLDHLTQLGRHHESVSLAEVARFCRGELALVKTKSLHEELTSELPLVERSIEESFDSLLVYYVLLRAANHFRVIYGHWPGELSNEAVEGDIPLLKTCVNKLLNRIGARAGSVSIECMHELCRWGGGEVASVAAFTGAVTAQEAIKLITKQYVPINHTYIFSAITSTSETFPL